MGAPPGGSEAGASSDGRAGVAVRPGTADYDLHGIVGLRLIDASPRDITAVTRQIGPIRGELARDPDIVVHFVERLPPTGPLRYVGLDDVGFTDEAFLVLGGAHRSAVKVQLPLERAGGRCEIVCESGLPAVPLLIAVLNLTALSKGVLPLHASAFSYEGTGVLVTGWAKGGKTETLLAFMANGAVYVGDEWIYLSPDGGRVYGIPEPIKLWDWHLTEVPRYRALLGNVPMARLRALRSAEQVGRATARALGDRAPGLLGRATHIVRNQRHLHALPAELFGGDRCSLECNLDKVFLVLSHESPEVRAERIDPQEIARRMVFSLEHE